MAERSSDSGLLDTTAAQQAERVLQARLRLSELVSAVAAGFMDVPATEIGRGIDTALKIVGEILDFDCCYVGLFSEDRKALQHIHLWARDGSQRPPRDTFLISEFPSSCGLILSGHDFIFDSIADLGGHDEAQRIAVTGTQALAAMPLRIGRDIIGLVGFADIRQPRRWSPEVLTSMRLTIEIIASALDRKQKDERLRARQEFDALLARVSRDFITAPLGSLDEVVPRALLDVGETLRFDRALIYRREPASTWTYLWHEWLAPGMPSLRPEFERLNRSEHSYMPPGYLQGEGVIVAVDTLPADATLYHRILKRPPEILLIALAPMLIAGQNFGSVTLHCRTRRSLPEEFRRQLTLLGELFGSVIARMEAERAREHAYQELEALKSRIERERDYLREEIRSERQTEEILGSSAAIRSVLDIIAQVAATPATVLIRGESGVGKELIARAIHERSLRRDGPLVKVNCASVPRELFESEFFGHVRGAFTSAYKDRAGRFELADRGTLFLDEVGDIPLDLQAKLLRVLQEGAYERVGEGRTRKANVRIIAATNRDLDGDIAAGRFRRDLYYRLSTFPIEVPPLRQRGDDVIWLARHFLNLYARNAGKRGLTLTQEHERLLCGYSWPGNVRELQHVIERAVILSSGSRLRFDLALPKLPPPAPSQRPAHPPAPVPDRPLATPQPMPMKEFKRLERDNILAALEQARWRIAGAGGAAELLGLKPSTLRDRMRALGITRDR